MIKKETIVGPCRLLLGDCMEILPTLGKFDAVVTDPPYGTTSNKWDIVVPFSVLWSIKSSLWAITASQPFTAKAVLSKIDWFRHEWIWIKNRGSNFANTVREPMKEHESVLIFAPSKWTYNKQYQDRTGGGEDRVKYAVAFESQSENYRDFDGRPPAMLPQKRIPSSWQKFNTEVGYHPTQKPVSLFEYLVNTYSNCGETILDPFMGSGTTGVACIKTGRQFTGIEIDEKYYDIAVRRCREAWGDGSLFDEKLIQPEKSLFEMESA